MVTKIFINVILNLFQDPNIKKTRCRNKFGMTTRMSRGFTLVELLASIIVLVAIGSVIASIISSSLQGSNKTNNIEDIRRSGDNVLSQMSKDIAYAQAFDSNGNSTGFNFDSTGTRKTKYLTSCYYPPIPYVSDITVRSATNVITKYECSGTNFEKTITGVDGTVSGPFPLIDTGFSIALVSCSMTCTQGIAGAPIIGISFRLQKGIQNSLVEKIVEPITFQTSVTMRNYGR